MCEKNDYVHRNLNKKITRKNRQDLWVGFYGGRKSIKQDLFINNGS